MARPLRKRIPGKRHAGAGTEENPRNPQHHRAGGAHDFVEMFVVKRLQGDADFKVSDESNFPAATDWVATLNALEESHTQLMEALKSFPEHKLHETVPNASAPYSFYILLHGIVHHDLYHTGQIMLIRRAEL